MYELYVKGNEIPRKNFKARLISLRHNIADVPFIRVSCARDVIQDRKTRSFSCLVQSEAPLTAQNF